MRSVDQHAHDDGSDQRPQAVTDLNDEARSIHDGRVLVDSEYRCPDCGALVWVPLDVELLCAEGALRVDAQLREGEFRPAFEQHVMLNPDRHPTFVTRTE